MSETQSVRIIVLREGYTFVAQCLEYDICTQAGDIETLQDRMGCLIEVELREAQALDQAPERFHKMWEQAFYKTAGNHQHGLMAA